jgi:hypothetical protein
MPKLTAIRIPRDDRGLENMSQKSPIFRDRSAERKTGEIGTARNRQQPNRHLIETYALEVPNFGRALAGMGFTCCVGPFPRGCVPGFEPTYHRHRPMRARLANSNTIAARGLHSGAWPDAAHRSTDAADRERIAEANRLLKWGPCRFMIRYEPPKVAVYIDEITGEWRDTTGGARGNGLIDLAAMMKSLPYDQAGYWLACVCGLDGVPEVPNA